MSDWLAKVIVDEGELILGLDWRWQPQSKSDKLVVMADIANLIYGSPFYIYSAADGKPGAVVAHALAKHWSGKVELPPDIEVPEGEEVIY